MGMYPPTAAARSANGQNRVMISETDAQADTHEQQRVDGRVGPRLLDQYTEVANPRRGGGQLPDPRRLV